jgi:peroxiredoxin Q/BCP
VDAVLLGRREQCAARDERGHADQRVTRARNTGRQHPQGRKSLAREAQECHEFTVILARVTATDSALPQVGQPAPDFTLPSTDGADVTLSSFKGKQAVVLYFYPRDDTPGCTAEACSFRDLRGLFNDNGAEILGVSADTLKSHKKFIDKYHLTFQLLADPDHAVADQYGVWQQKKFMGRQYMGIARTTFVVDKNGTIKAVFPNVKVDGHADKVLEALKS